MSDKQSIRQKFRANITASGSTGVQGGTEYPVHGEAQVRVQTSGFGGTNVVEIQVKIFDGAWSTLDSVTGNADSGALDVSAWDFVRFNVTTADGTGTIVASGFFSKAQSAGGGASAAFTIVQADSGTSPTATGATDTLTVTGSGGIATSGDATTDTLTLSLNINGLTADATPDGAADYVVTYDASAGANKKVLLNNLPGGGGGSGDVVGPASSTDNAIARFDGVTGKLLQNSVATISDTGIITSMHTTYTASMGLGTGITFTGDRAFAFGHTTTAFTDCVAIGHAASANPVSTGRSTAVGKSANASGAAGTAIGYNTQASNTSTVALGQSSISSGIGAVAIGNSAQATNNYAFSMGQTAVASGQYTILIGVSGAVSGTQSIGFGRNVSVVGQDACAIGYLSSAGHNFSYCLGAYATSTAANQLVLGGHTAGVGGFKDVYIGYGVTNTTNNQLNIYGTSASGTDVSANDITFNAQRGTGTGAGGHFLFKTAPAGTSGSALNALVTRLEITDDGNIIMPTLPTASAGLPTGALWNNGGVINIV